jgi:hypothetical protein
VPSFRYDAHFFIEHHYSSSEDIQRRTKLGLTANKSKPASATSIHEV